MANRKNQRTIHNEVSMKGVGLHTGRKCRATFKPAQANSGVRFVRTDLPGQPSFLAHVNNVVDIIRGTTLGTGEERLYTIEHLLSALSGIGIDNIVIEIDDSEPPVADGSSKDFVEALLKAGIKELDEPVNYFIVEKPFEYKANNTIIRIEPSESFEVHGEVTYDHPLIQNQKFSLRDLSRYQTDIAPARTYCFDYEIEALKKRGLAKGGSLDNAIVIGPSGIYNPGNFLRFKDEFVRHKILDLMGDLTLLGTPIQGRVIAKRSGHGHNIKFLKELIKAHPQTAPVSVN